MTYLLRGEPTVEAPVEITALLLASLITDDAGLLMRLRSRSISRSRLAGF